ncbi:MAG: hypothetical protein ACFFB5_13990 [Promethearchaeota archaeon]
MSKKEKQTLYRNIYLEIEANDILKEIKDKKKRYQQCSFKNRLIDGFIIGVTRSFANGRSPKELPRSKREKTDSVNVPSLSDREEVGFILKTIAYGHMLDEIGRNEEKRDYIHKILLDLSECSRIAEEYFKGGWNLPRERNFKLICLADAPDSELLEDFNLIEWEDEIKDDIKEKQ